MLARWVGGGIAIVRSGKGVIFVNMYRLSP